MRYTDKVASALLEIKAIKLSPVEPFTWASGLKSPIYCDNRLLLSFPKVRKLVVNSFCDLINCTTNPKIVAGVATAGIAHAALVANQLDLPMIYVRSKAKAHGRQNIIEGALVETEDVVVIEDLLSTGGSSIEAAKVLQQENAKISGIYAIFTYNLTKADINFQNAGINKYTITDYDTMLEIALKSDYITSSEMESLQKWKEDPVQWSKVNS